MSQTYGWYNHIMLLAQSDLLKINDVVEMNHKQAFMALCYLIDVNN